MHGLCRRRRKPLPEATQPPSSKTVRMGNSGINVPVPEQNNPGGDAMEQQTITMGQVTYELRRVFQGTRPLSELMAERIVQNIPAARSVDGGAGHEV